MHSVPKWQRPDRWVTLPCVRAHSWPDDKCPLLPTTLTIPPAHLKTGFGLVIPSCVVRPGKGPKRQFSWFRLTTDEASPVCRAESSVMAVCSEGWCLHHHQWHIIQTFSVPQETDEKTKLGSLTISSNHFQ